MNTFFQKLTGPQEENNEVEQESEEITPLKPSMSAQGRRILRHTNTSMPEKKATKIKVEADLPQMPAHETLPEEEGELTVDIYDGGDAIVIQSTVAGVKPEDLDITITTDTVTIRGSRERSEATKEDSYYYKELFWGTFSRSVILPEEIDEDTAEAMLKHGLLTIRLPKKRKNVAQKLKVKSV